ncbi:hypothetical protein HU200_032849 [Digitaria exilis]|uniref:Polygalacturonase n=1 Tax=Digitaria exilis TaxID=1010633 RepID=A0A835BMK3_9POAL|nr:hypothetical protein HU200_032849 [Digitaria exilis]
MDASISRRGRSWRRTQGAWSTPNKPALTEHMGASGIICAAILLAGLALAAAGGELVFDVVAHGARGDGITDDTKAFEAAWAAACSAKGPSASMVVPAQRSFLVGPVSFQGPCGSGRITVQIQGKIVAPPSSVLSAWSNGTNDYWIMFSRVDGLTVTGNGVLDGNGQSWWVKRCSEPGCVQSAPTLMMCNNLELNQLSSKDSPQMHIAILNSIGVNVSGLTITAPGTSPNTDGIHIGGSQNVHISSSSIATGDDCISIISGSRFVTVDGVACGPGHGVRYGNRPCDVECKGTSFRALRDGDTATVEFIDVRNVNFTNTMYGARIKTWEGYAKSISFSNINFDNVDHPVLIDQFYRDNRASFQPPAVAISNVTYSNLTGTSSLATAVAFDCSDGGSCRDIHVNSLMITGSGGRQTVAISGQIDEDRQTTLYAPRQVLCKAMLTRGDLDPHARKYHPERLNHWQYRETPYKPALTEHMGASGIVCAVVVLAGLALACPAAGGELVFDVVAHGARGDGITDDTKVRNVRVVIHVSLKAFEAAWAAACGAKGSSASMVVPPQRSFLVGPVSFQGPCASGRITVQIQGRIVAPPSSAVSTWSRARNDYWLMFNRVDGLTVTGNGIIDGNGPSWWSLKLVRCNNLELSQLSSKDSPQMHIAILNSNGVNVRGLTITAPGTSPNTDGIHIGDSQNVLITRSFIGTGDDCVSISSGSRFVTVDGIGYENRSMRCDVVDWKSTSGLCAIGSLGKYGDTAAVEFIDVRNVHFANTMYGARIKTWEFDNVDHPVLIDQFYRDRLSFQPAVAISNVTYNNLKGTSTLPTAVAFDCSDGGSCTNIHVNSLMITGSGGRQTVAISGHVYPEIPCRS